MIGSHSGRGGGGGEGLALTAPVTKLGPPAVSPCRIVKLEDLSAWFIVDPVTATNAKTEACTTQTDQSMH